jgi:hypothetical protein
MSNGLTYLNITQHATLTRNTLHATRNTLHATRNTQHATLNSNQISQIQHLILSDMLTLFKHNKGMQSSFFPYLVQICYLRPISSILTLFSAQTSQLKEFKVYGGLNQNCKHELLHSGNFSFLLCCLSPLIVLQRGFEMTINRRPLHFVILLERMSRCLFGIF